MTAAQDDSKTNNESKSTKRYLDCGDKTLFVAALYMYYLSWRPR